MAWWQWGDPGAAHAVVCVHGLTRQGRDFDVLAQALLARAAQLGQPLRVLCPDVVGRGHSDWLSDPAGYQFPTYVADMLALLQAAGQSAPLKVLDWVGTSMGGIIGLWLAAMDKPPVPVRKLVLNDVGPAIEWQALQRIGQYLGKTGPFETEAEGVARLREIAAGFGPHTDAQWQALMRPMLRPRAEGGWRLHYDPAIAVPYASLSEAAMQQGEAALWQLYEQVRADTLVLRGAESDLLSAATAQAMSERGPRAALKVFDGVGHAPTLVPHEQLRAVLDFLFGPAKRDGA